MHFGLKTIIVMRKLLHCLTRLQKSVGPSYSALLMLQRPLPVWLHHNRLLGYCIVLLYQVHQSTRQRT